MKSAALNPQRLDVAKFARAGASLAGEVTLESFQRLSEGTCLPVDEVVDLRCAVLHVADPRPERDALIAATALVHGMTLVTRNVADFEPMGVPLFNPWATEPARRR